MKSRKQKTPSAAEQSKVAEQRRSVRTLRFMLMLVIVTIVAFSGFLSGTLFVFGYLAKIGLIRGMSITMLILAPVIISSLLTLFLTSLWSGRLLRPLKQLTAATRQVAEGNFSVRIPETKGKDEIAHLVSSFNLMLDELEHNEIFRKDFINNFSHEFKTPIVSIRGFARQLQNESLTEAQKREYIDIIIAESDRLAGMSTNILLLTKLENQTIVTDRAPLDLDEQIRSEILLLEAEWTGKNLSVSPELEEIRLNSSAELLSHIWRNLLANAIKFSPPGGELKVDLYRERSGGGTRIVFRVTDEGPGMDEETASHIFDKFYQGDTSHKTEGNGLGLSIAYRAAVLCGGSIDVQSAPGCGCTFTVRLPE